MKGGGGSAGLSPHLGRTHLLTRSITRGGHRGGWPFVTLQRNMISVTPMQAEKVKRVKKLRQRQKKKKMNDTSLPEKSHLLPQVFHIPLSSTFPLYWANLPLIHPFCFHLSALSLSPPTHSIFDEQTPSFSPMTNSKEIWGKYFD